MARIVYALLCDDVRVEAENNKQTLVGVFDRFTIGRIPGVLPGFAIFTRVLFDDYEVEYNFGIELHPPRGAAVGLLAGRATVSRPGPDLPFVYDEPLMNITFRFEAVEIEEEGLHRFVFMIGTEPAGDLPFLVRLRPAAQPTVSPTEPPPPSSQSPSSSDR